MDHGGSVCDDLQSGPDGAWAEHVHGGVDRLAGGWRGGVADRARGVLFALELSRVWDELRVGLFQGQPLARCGAARHGTGDDRVDARRRARGGEDGVCECGEVLGFQLDNGVDRVGGRWDFVRETCQSGVANAGRGRGGVVFFEGRVSVEIIAEKFL